MADLLAYVIKSSVVLALAIGLDYLFIRSPKVRDILWPLAFVATVLAFVALPPVRIAIGSQEQSLAVGHPVVYETLPGFLATGVVEEARTESSWMPAIFVALSVVGLAVLAVKAWLSVKAVKSFEQSQCRLGLDTVYLACNRLGISSAPHILESDRIPSPLLFGLWNPVVVVPSKSVAVMSERDWKLVLFHELLHVRRKDHWKIGLLRLGQALLWWNPLVHIAARSVVRTIEESTDIATIKATGVEPKQYQESLLRMSCGQDLDETELLSATGYTVRRFDALTAPSPSPAVIPLALVSFLLLFLPSLNWAVEPQYGERTWEVIGTGEVVYTALEGKKPRLFRMYLSGQGHAPLSLRESNGLGQPDVSKDGTKLAFTRVLPGSDADIGWSSINGTEMQFLQRPRTRDVGPQFSPDGSRILFNSYYSSTEIERWAVIIWDIDTGSSYQVTIPGRDGDNFEASWHPNGHRIVLSSRIKPSGFQEIWSVSVDSRDAVRLVARDGTCTGASYSPDGRYLLYSCDERSNFDLYRLDLKTGMTLRLTDSHSDDVEARWEPGGETIVYATGTGKGKNERQVIASIDREGRGFRILSAPGQTAFFPAVR